MICLSSSPYALFAAWTSVSLEISSIFAFTPGSFSCDRLLLPFGVMLRPSNSGGRKVAPDGQSGHQPVIAMSFCCDGVPITS